MGIKIVSKRKIKKDQEAAINPLITQLRKMAKNQPGFKSEEIWNNIVNPEDYLVVRAWESIEDWDTWHSSEKRVEIQEKIEALLERKTEYTSYEIIYRAEN